MNTTTINNGPVICSCGADLRKVPFWKLQEHDDCPALASRDAFYYVSHPSDCACDGCRAAVVAYYDVDGVLRYGRVYYRDEAPQVDAGALRGMRNGIIGMMGLTAIVLSIIYCATHWNEVMAWITR